MPEEIGAITSFQGVAAALRGEGLAWCKPETGGINYTVVDGPNGWYSFKNSGRGQNTGFKAHISVDPTRLDDALKIIIEEASKNGICEFKIADLKNSLEFANTADEQCGKFFVIFDHGEKGFGSFLKAVEGRFHNANISPGPAGKNLQGPSEVRLSPYSYARNDKGSNGKYSNADLQTEFNPQNHPVPEWISSKVGDGKNGGYVPAKVSAGHDGSAQLLFPENTTEQQIRLFCREHGISPSECAGPPEVTSGHKVLTVRSGTASCAAVRGQFFPSATSAKTHGAYQRSDIVEFVERNVQFVEGDENVLGRAARIKEIYANTIAELPAWQQSLIIEGNRPIIVGKHPRVVAQNAGALYSPKDDTVFLRDFDSEMQRQTPASELDFIKNISHEHGHQLDRNASEVPGQYWSENPKWKAAVQAEIQSRPQTHRSVIVDESKGVFRGLREHIIGPDANNPAYHPKTHAREALAEMTAVFNETYKQRGNNWQAANHFMQQHYPHAWPVYRDKFIPRLQEVAHRLNPNIDVAVDAHQKAAPSVPKSAATDTIDAKVMKHSDGNVHLLFPEGATDAQIRAFCKEHSISPPDSAGPPHKIQFSDSSEKHMRLVVKQGTPSAEAAEAYAIEKERRRSNPPASQRSEVPESQPTKANGPEAHAKPHPNRDQSHSSAPKQHHNHGSQSQPDVLGSTSQNLGKANAIMGGVGAITDLAQGDYAGAGLNAVQAGVGYLGDILPKRAGVLGAVGVVVGGINDGIHKYQETGDATDALAAVGDGVVQGGAMVGAMAAAPTIVGGVTTTVAGMAGVAEAGALGAAATAATGTILTVGSAVVGAAAVGYGIGTAIDKTFDVSGKTADAVYSGTQEKINQTGNTAGMKQVDAKGLPEISDKQNHELAKLLDGNVDESKQLSANPQLAAKGITNAQDPEYLQKQLDRAKNEHSKPGFWDWAREKAGMPSGDRIAKECELGMAQIELNVYRKKFEAWKASNQVADGAGKNQPDADTLAKAKDAVKGIVHVVKPASAGDDKYALPQTGSSKSQSSSMGIA